MIHPFQPKISHHWHKHADGLEHIRQVSLAAGGGNHRTQQVVKPENVPHIKILQPRPAVTLDRRIPTHCPVMQPGRHIDGLHAILIPPPTKRRPFSGDFRMESEEHTSELQSLAYLVCRLLLEKKNEDRSTFCCTYIYMTITC